MVKKYSIYLSIILAVLLLTACGNNDQADQAEQDAGELEINDEELVPDDEIIATINDTDVLGKTYNMVYAQLKLHAGQTNQELDEDEIKEATLDSIVDRELLMQQAETEGIAISEKEATEELNKLKSENEQNLTTILEQYQMSEDDFKEQLQFELTLNEYKQEVIAISISEEEIEEYYEKAKENNEDIPELEEIKPQLKAQMEEQKSTEALQKKIEEVKKTAKIEKKMDA